MKSADWFYRMGILETKSHDVLDRENGIAVPQKAKTSSD